MRVNKLVVVRDHCHWTGKFRGAAHQTCNLLYGKTYKIHLFFHNFTWYASHIDFMNISNLEEPANVIAKSMEKFKSIEIEGVVLKESLQFLECGLFKVGSNLKDKVLKENKSLKDTFPTVYNYFKKEWVI